MNKYNNPIIYKQYYMLYYIINKINNYFLIFKILKKNVY